MKVGDAWITQDTFGQAVLLIQKTCLPAQRTQRSDNELHHKIALMASHCIDTGHTLTQQRNCNDRRDYFLRAVINWHAANLHRLNRNRHCLFESFVKGFDYDYDL